MGVEVMEMRRYVVMGIHALGDEYGSYESYEMHRTDDEQFAWELYRSYAGEPEEPVLDLSDYYDGEVRVLACAAQVEDPEDQVVLLEIEEEEEVTEMRQKRQWKLVADEFGSEPVVFEAESAEEAAEELANIWRELYGWKPNFEVMLDDSVAIRWHHRLDCLDCTSKVLDGEEEFDREYWLRHPNWMTVLAPVA